MMNVYKLLRGTFKHWAAQCLDYTLDRVDWILRQTQLKVYDLFDWSSELHTNAHDDLNIDEYKED